MISSNILPPGSLILVSGANGFIGSHIIDQLLKHDYKVRGTVRDTQKSTWVQNFFDERHGTGKLELVQVPDFTKEGCFDDAVKGVVAFAHVASDLSFSNDPNVIVTPVVQSVRFALSAASKEPGLKRVVLTSSSTAATKPKPNLKFHIDRSMWNEEDITDAWGDAPTAWSVYGASKAQGEQEAWKFMKEQKPQFTFNSILPNANFGEILEPEHQQGSTAGWIIGVCKDKWEQLKAVPPQYYVAVEDTALLHVAALTDLSITDQRIFAFAETYTWGRILDIIKKLRPDLTLPEAKSEDMDLSTVENEPAERILKGRFGKKGWTPLEEALQRNIKAL